MKFQIEAKFSLNPFLLGLGYSNEKIHKNKKEHNIIIGLSFLYINVCFIK